MDFTIANFWKTRLTVQRADSAKLVDGWSYVTSELSTFKEAPLLKSSEVPFKTDPQSSPLLIVSAPGAVGKTTLARQIAYVTGSVYVDLARAAPVGGNTLSGGLVRSSIYDAWKSETTTVLIDGLDEARLRVTQESFEAFLNDVAEISKGRKVPIVLFGRTGAAQDSWLLLSDKGADAPVLEIGYYDEQDSLEFAELQLRAIDPMGQHASIQRTALALLLKKLRTQTESDGDRFAGYAPVLTAVAERVAHDTNPAALVADIDKGEQQVTLQAIVAAIQERERGKLSGLHFEVPNVAESLYKPDEQLDRLVARVFGFPAPPLPQMAARDAQTYSAALDTWVGEHPSLKGNIDPSSLVFDAAITTWALREPKAAAVALNRELVRGAAANPFLSEFYLPDGSAEHTVPPEHIVIIYASLRSRLSLGDSANLLIEGAEDETEEEVLRAEVEITLARRGVDRPRAVHFSTEQTGPIRLGPYVDDVEINVPYTKVEIGPGPEAALIAPVAIQSNELSLTTERLVVENAPDADMGSVYLETQNFDGPKITTVPTLRGKVSLSVSWPGARSRPWTNFAVRPSEIDNPKLDEALRRFRKFVISFRSHSKGSLARYRHKIEHERMTKGTGQAVLNLLTEEKSLSLDSGKSMYFLDPSRLSTVAGANYYDTMARKFDQKTIAFVRRAIK
jgi:hypothetical protein